MPDAVLSIKSRRLCDFAVCNALLEGHKVEIFREENKLKKKKKKTKCGIPRRAKTNPSKKLELPQRRTP